FGLYSLLGGLRGSILIEALQVAVLLVIALVLTIGFWTFNGDLGIYERLRALAPREGANYLAMASLSALLFGVVNTIVNLGLVVPDDAVHGDHLDGKRRIHRRLIVDRHGCLQKIPPAGCRGRRNFAGRPARDTRFHTPDRSCLPWPS